MGHELRKLCLHVSFGATFHDALVSASRRPGPKLDCALSLSGCSWELGASLRHPPGVQVYLVQPSLGDVHNRGPRRASMQPEAFSLKSALQLQTPFETVLTACAIERQLPLVGEGPFKLVVHLARPLMVGEEGHDPLGPTYAFV